MLVVKKKEAASGGDPESQVSSEEQKSRKSRQEPMDAEALEKYADEFYELAMAAYENMQESARIMRLCERGTTIKPSSSNTRRMMQRVVANAVDFASKAAKTCRSQGRDPKMRLK
jgi:hypothetical protein